MHELSIAVVVFLLMVPAELPDKTFVATLVLGTRFRGMPVFLGASLGFAVQCGIAVAAGSAVALLPSSLVHAVTAAIFAIGAVLMLRPTEDANDEEREVEGELADVPSEPSDLRVFTTSFVIVFLAEWGDLTQLLTASLSAKYHAPVAVFVGALLGLMTVAAIGVISGKAILRIIPLIWVRRVAAAAFGVVAGITALEATNVL
jgi:Ca2+/H+ antiporter, TMEM165/GDT1 family